MDKRFWAIVGIIIIVFFGFLLVQRNDEAGAPANKNAKPTNHTKGEGTANVNLTEYGDFQCPACAQYYPIVEQVAAKYEQEITFQFRHFPLVSIHPNAFAGSRAAEAAGKQGKFWEMYNQLYVNQDSWSGSNSPTKIFEGYAKQIGLNVEQFKTDFASSAVNDAINADMAAGNAVKAQSTPTFVLDGKKIENPAPTIEAFSKIIDEAIAKKKQANE
jgi:protein-disulfide isomerase